MNKKEKTTVSKKRKKIRIALIFWIVIGIVAAAGLVSYGLNVGVVAAKSAFSDSLEQQREETYQTFYERSFDIAEEKYHVANRVTISVEDVREEAELEVLQVSDIEYVYNEGNTKIWTAVKGHGVYTVDLSLGEFVVDNARQYVLARVPAPRLGSAGLDYEYENYLFEDGIFNGSTKEGIDLARNDLRTAQNQLQVKLSSTQIYYENAQRSAEEMIRNLVKNCNPDAARLVIDVEFID